MMEDIMRNKIIIAVVVAVALFHIAWYASSCSYQKQAPPDLTTGRDILYSYMNKMKIHADLKNMEDVFIDVNESRLHLIVFPAGKKAPTLVFIPGTSVYAGFYIEYIYAMYKQGFNVIGLDPRGHGLSSGARGDYTITTIVDDALAVVKYARGRFGGRVAVAGSSQGGIAAFYAAARDDSLAGAVCHNIADLNARDNLVLSQVRPPLPLVPLAEFMSRLYGSYSIPISLYLNLKEERMKDGTSAPEYTKTDPIVVKRITIRALGSLLHTDLAKPVEKIKVPIMLVHADKDSIFPQSYVEGIYNRLTCPKKYLLFKNTEHLVMTNNVDRVVPQVAAWLKEKMR
jgi:pimeloyl-ACP methyl ester carboxylesterase